MTRSVKTYIGPPGTGKTYTLLEEVGAALKRGIAPNRIAYLAFTRAAATEAKRRAVALFPGVVEGDMPWFRTIHSAAFKLRNLSREDVMATKNWLELGGLIGTTFSGRYDAERWSVFESGTLGDRCLKLHARAIARGISLADEYNNSNEEYLALATVERFRHDLDEYKASRSLLDFVDMLEYDAQPLDVDVVIIDEGQDLTIQQWKWARQIARNASSIILAGDDDQAIYTWAGADASILGSFKGERKVLPISHRLPSAIKNLADNVIQKVSSRIPKAWSAREKGGAGEICWWRGFDELDLSSGKWLLLARHHHQLKDAVDACRQRGVVYYYEGKWSNDSEEIRAVLSYEKLRRDGDVPYSEARNVASWIIGMPPPKRIPGRDTYRWDHLAWPFSDKRDWMGALSRLPPSEREYIRSLRRNGEPLQAPGRVEISTIHGAKGWEADNVSLSLDVSRQVERSMRTNTDDETRVFYVGLTRAKESLHLIQPSTARAFKL